MSYPVLVQLTCMYGSTRKAIIVFTVLVSDSHCMLKFWIKFLYMMSKTVRQAVHGLLSLFEPACII